MVTNEELMFHIKAKEQEISLAQQELQNRQQGVLQNVQQNVSKPTMIQRAFRMFNDLTKPKQRMEMGNNSIVPDRVGFAVTNEVRDEELDYFKKLLRKRDIEIRKQKHMITKMNAPKRYIKKEFMESRQSLNDIQSSRNIIKKKISPRVNFRSSTNKDRESAKLSRQSRARQSPTAFRRKEAWLK